MSPIGIFDSGYGGLTILRQIRQLMPQYDYLYLGDNARAPYGTRSFDITMPKEINRLVIDGLSDMLFTAGISNNSIANKEGAELSKVKEKEAARFRRDNLGFVFQDFNLLDTLTGYENISLSLSIKNIPYKKQRNIVRSKRRN